MKSRVKKIEKPAPPATPADWTFFSNHLHVLFCLAENPSIRLREVAVLVGITERMVQKIVTDLVDAGFITIAKQGRCNTYKHDGRLPLRHPLESHCTIGQVLDLVRSPAKKTK